MNKIETAAETVVNVNADESPKADKKAKAIIKPGYGEYLTEQRRKARSVIGNWCAAKGISLSALEAEFSFGAKSGKLNAVIDTLKDDDQHDAAMKVCSTFSRKMAEVLRLAQSLESDIADAKRRAQKKASK